MLSFIYRKRQIWGIIFLTASLFPNFFPNRYKTGVILTLFFALYCIGITFICDYITYKIDKVSVLKNILKTNANKLTYFIIGFMGGFILEGIVTYLGGLWVYPFYSIPVYFIITVLLGGFGLYFLSIVLSYTAFKALLDKVRKGRKKVTKPFKSEKIIFTILFILGLIGLIFIFFRVMVNTKLLANFVFNISTEKNPYLDFSSIILSFFSFWFIFEFIAFKRKRNSLLKNIFHDYWNPLFAIVLASIVLSVYMEIQNVPIRLWIYTNWPYQDIKFLGIPFLVYLAWPLHYIGFLSAYRAFGDEPSREIWTGDDID